MCNNASAALFIYLFLVPYAILFELLLICRYMKVRLTLEQVNAAIEELNKALHSKYAIIRTSKPKMTDAIRRAIQEYKDQETFETKGIIECTILAVA